MVYGGLDSSRTNDVCWHDAPAVHIRSLPQHGCVHFVRVPGVDDEPAPPKEFIGGDHAGWRKGQPMNSSTDFYRPGLHPFAETTA
jgi:hypothetical protein